MLRQTTWSGRKREVTFGGARVIGSTSEELIPKPCMWAFQYRVTLVVVHLGWVDYDLGHPTVCTVPLGKFG